MAGILNFPLINFAHSANILANRHRKSSHFACSILILRNSAQFSNFWEQIKGVETNIGVLILHEGEVFAKTERGEHMHITIF